MNQVATIDTNNFNAMAKAMGMQADAPKASQGKHPCTVAYHHTPIMGQQEIGGKKKNVEVISGGAYKLEIPDGPTYYAESVAIRPFLQTVYVQEVHQG